MEKEKPLTNLIDESITKEKILDCLQMVASKQIKWCTDRISEPIKPLVRNDFADWADELYQLIQQARQETAREIFEVYDKYLELLVEEIDSLMGLAISHGWQSSRVEAGKKCRADIQSLKDKFLKEGK